MPTLINRLGRVPSRQLLPPPLGDELLDGAVRASIELHVFDEGEGAIIVDGATINLKILVGPDSLEIIAGLAERVDFVVEPVEIVRRQAIGGGQ